MSVIKYGASQQTQFRSASPLSEQEFMKYAPSIFAEHPHDSRGQRYAFIPTAEVVRGLQREGFQAYEVRQTRCRDESKREFTKHLMRFRHPDALPRHDGEIPEIILVNSHDGTSSYQLMSGIFRMICSNGLISGDISDSIRIRHSGKVVQDVIEGSFRVIDNLKQVENRIDDYKSIQLDKPEQLLLAHAAHSLRWDDPQTAPVEAEKLIEPHRWEDRVSDLWHTFNTIQESLVNGGVKGHSANGRRITTRAVGGVQENVKLNRALWALADSFAALKRGDDQVK